ncbi:SMP-30/gluconolactonase/LRE family protein [Tellurirhabdus rosea]|uniref:SMP-30/gluconolactonase/LRE family protein n=1 Tax=Tellurirhabdus rosea TaxID=2674997 RepID=UPI00225BCCF3|nr:SMP-30/gluconolactonase/LRE family protein [Tellurirhabdus rosea]
MNRFRFIRPLAALLTLFAQIAFARPAADSLTVVAPGAKPRQVSQQFKFTEGPAVDKKGNIYFTDQPNDHIWKYDTDGNLSLFMEKTGRSNGLYIDKKGNIIACADEKNELWSINPKNKAVTVLLPGQFEGKKFNGPNDLWITPKGDIYFTDPFYPRPWWTHKTPEQTGQKVFFLKKGTQTPVVVDAALMQPNGIVGTPDGKTLYVADIRDKKTYKYQINTDGSLGNRQLFCEMGSDGMTLDSQGNLYITGQGVTVFDPSGRKLGNIPVPAGWTANVCFGGKDRKTLFITASQSVFVLPMTVKGVE